MTSIEVNMDSATVFGQTVRRPYYVSRSAWMAFWEKIIHAFREPY